MVQQGLSSSFFILSTSEVGCFGGGVGKEAAPALWLSLLHCVGYKLFFSTAETLHGLALLLGKREFSTKAPICQQYHPRLLRCPFLVTLPAGGKRPLHAPNAQDDGTWENSRDVAASLGLFDICIPLSFYKARQRPTKMCLLPVFTYGYFPTVGWWWSKVLAIYWLSVA